MENDNFDRIKYIKSFVLVLAGFFVITMTVMMFYAANKVVIVSAEEAEALVKEEFATETVNKNSSWKLEIRSSNQNGNFIINCPDSASLVNISERPDLKTVSFIFEDITADYFKNNPPSGDFSDISDIYVITTDLGTILEFSLKEMKVPDIVAAGKTLKVSFKDYVSDNVAIIDPFYGGVYTGAKVGQIDEKSINLKIAKRVRELSGDKDYTVYLTRTADITLSTEDRIGLIEKLSGDYYVGISLNANMEDEREFGMSAVYNGNFYRNGFENVDFAETLLKETATEAKDRALSLEKAGDDNVILMTLEIPGACIKAGTITNADEASLLTDDEYIDKIAKGIIKALDETVAQ